MIGWPLLLPVSFEALAAKEPSPRGPQGEVTFGRLPGCLSQRSLLKPQARQLPTPATSGNQSVCVLWGEHARDNEGINKSVNSFELDLG